MSFILRLQLSVFGTVFTEQTQLKYLPCLRSLWLHVVLNICLAQVILKKVVTPSQQLSCNYYNRLPETHLAVPCAYINRLMHFNCAD